MLCFRPEVSSGYTDPSLMNVHVQLTNTSLNVSKVFSGTIEISTPAYGVHNLCLQIHYNST